MSETIFRLVWAGNLPLVSKFCDVISAHVIKADMVEVRTMLEIPVTVGHESAERLAIAVAEACISTNLLSSRVLAVFLAECVYLDAQPDFDFSMSDEDLNLRVWLAIARARDVVAADCFFAIGDMPAFYSIVQRGGHVLDHFKDNAGKSVQAAAARHAAENFLLFGDDDV